MVDGQGRKMSKSVGNGIAPQTIRKMGAEIIRLWVRRHRLLGRPRHRRQDPGPRGRRLPPHPQHAALPAGQHLDFDPATDAVPAEQMLEIDRYALARAAELQAEVLAHFEVYEFHPGGRQAAGLLLRKTWAPSTSTC